MSHDEIMNDLQLPKREDSELEKAIQRIRLLYVEAKHMPGIRNPLAWAVHQAWKEVDRNDFVG